MISISPTLFFNSLPAEKHPEVKAMFDYQAVDHVVLMIADEGGDRHVITIGQESQYKDIPSFTSDSIEGMRPIAIVDAQKSYPDLSKVHSPKKHTKPAQLVKPRSAAYKPGQSSNMQGQPPQSKIEELKHSLAQERGKIMLRDQTILELKRHIEQLEKDTYSPESGKIEESVLIDREKSVLKAEEELINRLTYLMEKEAELEQFEEDLAHRATMLDAREGKPTEEPS